MNIYATYVLYTGPLRLTVVLQSFTKLDPATYLSGLGENKSLTFTHRNNSNPKRAPISIWPDAFSCLFMQMIEIQRCIFADT